MELNQIESHWQNWAKEFKTDLRATTKSSTAKQLEINALMQMIGKNINTDDPFSILEVGCGNGHNCFALQQAFAKTDITGVDFIEDMVHHAKELNHYFKTNIPFHQGNILELDQHPEIASDYDVVFTVRCVINLNTDELQHQGIEQLVKKVKTGGLLIMIENQKNTHKNQNTLRQLVDLPARKPAEFNHFMDQQGLLNKANELNLSLIETHNFSSLHDIILYTLIPMINDGEVDYQHPLVQAAADLTNAGEDQLLNSFGDFGQNKLFVFKKNAE